MLSYHTTKKTSIQLCLVKNNHKRDMIDITICIKLFTYFQLSFLLLLPGVLHIIQVCTTDSPNLKYVCYTEVVSILK